MGTTKILYKIRPLTKSEDDIKLIIYNGLSKMGEIYFENKHELQFIIKISFENSSEALKAQRKIIRFLMKYDGNEFGVLSQSTNLSEIHSIKE
jgi:hypothetical protein